MTDRLKGKRIMNVWQSFECYQTSQDNTERHRTQSDFVAVTA